MSVSISLHAASLGHFLSQIKKDREILICDADCDHRILHRLNLTSKERRPFTEAEIKKVLQHYRWFQNFFKKKEIYDQSDQQRSLTRDGLY